MRPDVGFDYIVGVLDVLLVAAFKEVAHIEGEIKTKYQQCVNWELEDVFADEHLLETYFKGLTLYIEGFYGLLLVENEA